MWSLKDSKSNGFRQSTDLPAETAIGSGTACETVPALLVHLQDDNVGLSNRTSIFG